TQVEHWVALTLASAVTAIVPLALSGLWRARSTRLAVRLTLVTWLALMALAAAFIPLLQDDAYVWAAAAAAPVAVVALVGRFLPRIAATLVAGLLPLVAFSTAGDLGPVSWWSTVA